MKKPLLFLMAVAFVPIHLWAQTINFESITPEQIPVGTKVIPKYAFTNRDDLFEAVIPEGVEIIEPDAFAGCFNLMKVTLPSTLVRAKGAFTWCPNLKDVTSLSIVPPFIGPTPAYYAVDAETFSWMSNLDDLYINFRWAQEGGVDGDSSGAQGKANWYVYDKNDIDDKILWFKAILGRKTYEDENLGKMPIKWTSGAYGLYGYDTDRERTIRDDEWPYDDVVYLTYKMRGHTLHYPSFSQYELEPGWNHFPVRRPFEMAQPASIRVGSNYTLMNSPFTQKPDLTLAVSMDNKNKVYYAGHMNVMGGTHSYGTFNLEQDIWENNIRVQNNGIVRATAIDRAHPTLYTEAPMRADMVKTTWRLDVNTYVSSSIQWIFTSLPFDCRLGDLRVTEGGNNLQWVIYKHSGQMRADAKFGEVWVKQTPDDILHAGEGFIFACGWNDQEDQTAVIELTAINNANKNRLFTTEDVSIPLQNYPAVAESHRSWNFIGNPYPCYFSTKYFEPTAPFVVYEKTWVEGWSQGHFEMGYKTYSPIDDDYLLAPFQSFFLQRPLGYDALNFPEYGRFVTVDEYEDFMGELLGAPDLSSSSEAPSYAQRRIGRRMVSALQPPVGTMKNRRVINLRLKNADGAELDRTRLVGNPDASIYYESICDATKFPDHTGNATLLYLIGEDLTHYAISEQPFVDGDEVSIGAKFPVTGEYTMQADFKTAYPELEGTLMLVDYETGHIQSATEPYTFTAQAGETTTRFALTYGEPTAIHEIRESYAPLSKEQGDVYYDLQGRPVTGILRPGIYIKNGKKNIIK